MIMRPRFPEGERPDPAMLASCLREHLARLPRLEKLRRYYDGRQDILQRRRADGLPNNRLAHAFPRYITAMASGYLIGNPVTYRMPAEDGAHARAALEALLDHYRACAIDSVDAELARNASIYGRAVELVYADEAAHPRSVSLDPRSAFVVYDDTVACAPLLGVYYAPVRLPEGGAAGWRVHVFTRETRLTYRVSALGEFPPGALAEEAPHYFGAVPLVEYWNDECERGDFEPVISLIDAYDALASDRLNDKQQFVDALLLLYGCTLETDARGRSPGQQLREDKALALPDSDAHAEFLCKQMNEADTQILREALRQDIHKLCMVPDMTDERFAGNASGVAMRYKLLGLEQLTKVKERWFREGLRARLGLYAAFVRRLGGAAVDVAAVQICFARALPVNELEVSQMLSGMRGIWDDDTLKARADALMGQA